MAYNIVMPQLSDSMTEGTLVEWKVQPGQTVKAGDVIAEVESDKAIQEIQTFHDGIVDQLQVPADTTVPVGTVIAVIKEANDTSTATPPSEAPKTAPSKAVEEEPAPVSSPVSTPQESEEAKAKTTKAATTPTKPTESSHHTESDLTPEEQAALAVLLGAPLPPISHPSTPHHGTASPKAKQLAQKYRLDLEALQAEGKLPTPAHTQAVAEYYFRQFFSPAALELIQAYQLDMSQFGSDHKHTKTEVRKFIQQNDIPLIRPIDRIQKTIIKSVSQSAQKPIYHLYDHLDASLMLAHKRQGSVTAWLIKLMGEMMMQHEDLRSQLQGEQLQILPNANIAVAIAIDKALYMPVLRHVNQLRIEDIHHQLKSLVNQAKRGRLTADQFQGSTFAISNLGMLGVKRFDAMINANDVGIAAIGATVEEQLSITLTFDHRLINGYQAAQALQTLKQLASDPEQFM